MNNAIDNILSLTRAFMLSCGLVFMVSSVIYAFDGTVNDKWFTRAIGVIVCYGFYAVLKGVSEILRIVRSIHNNINHAEH